MGVVALPSVGTVLAGKYKIVRVLGRGGMGIVYEAWHQRLHQRIAIKMLLPDFGDDPDVVGRFEREARAVAKLESPRVAKVLDVDTSPEGLPYMVIEFLEGHDLETELRDRGRLPIEEAVALIMEACVPIAEAHAKGIVHRDLKPSNLFIHEKDGERRLKLLDFGISKVAADADAKVTASFQSLGTPQYMSPEQVRHSKQIDGRTDIWSLGVILYELITGELPFPDENPSAVIAAIAADPITPPGMHRPEIPPELEIVIMRALAKDPSKRYKDVRSFAMALAPFAPEEELVAFPAFEAASGRRSIPDTFEIFAGAPTERPPPSTPQPSSQPPLSTPARNRTPAHTAPMPTPRPSPASTTPMPTPMPPQLSSSPPRITPMPLAELPGFANGRDSGHASGSWTGRPPAAPSRWKPIAVAVGLISVGVVITIVTMRLRGQDSHATPAPPTTVTVTTTQYITQPAVTTVETATATATTSASATAKPTVATAPTVRSTATAKASTAASASATPSAEPVNPLSL